MKRIIAIAFGVTIAVMNCFGQDKLGNAKPKYVAFLVGANDYKEFDNLNYPIEDINILKNTLKEYSFENIVSIENPTEKVFFDKANELKKIVKSNDYLLVYISMHGFLLDKRKYFWLPVDAKANESQTWIYVEEFLDVLYNIDCKHVLLIIDSCFGGSVFKLVNNKSIDSQIITQDDIDKYKSRQSSIAITSGANMEKVPDDSHFFKSLNKVLKNNPHQYLPVELLFNNVKEEVKITQNAEGFKGTKIEPLMSKLTYLKDNDGQFLFYKEKGIPPATVVIPTTPNVLPVDLPITGNTQQFKLARAIHKETINLNAGDRVEVIADGTITVGQFLGNVTPRGREKGLLGLSIDEYDIVPKYPHGALIYRILPSQSWVLCGDGCEIRATKSGNITIEFTINDNNTGDNSGNFDITLKKL